MNPDKVKAAIRRDLLARYARLTAAGRPEFCVPSPAERWGAVRRKEGPGGDGKVIFPDQAAAEECARRFTAMGARPMYAYQCKRSRHGHWHLSTDRGGKPDNPAAA